MIDVSKFIKSLGFAFEGIVALIKSENNARIHLLATILVIVAGIYSKISSTDWLWVGLAITLVWVTEAINTALETLVDLASPAQNPLAKKIKDIAAAAVLFTAGFALFVALQVFLFN